MRTLVLTLLAVILVLVPSTAKADDPYIAIYSPSDQATISYDTEFMVWTYQNCVLPTYVEVQIWDENMQEVYWDTSDVAGHNNAAIGMPCPGLQAGTYLVVVYLRDSLDYQVAIDSITIVVQ